MKKKHILALCFGLLACLYAALAMVSLYAESIGNLLPLVIADGVWVAAVFSIAALLSFLLPQNDFSVITAVAAVCTLISGYSFVTAEFGTLLGFFDTLLNTLPTLTIGFCFGFWWFVGVIRQHKKQTDRTSGCEPRQ